MKNAFKTTLSALALVAMTAVSASAATLSGLFNVTVVNVTNVNSTQSQATRGNFEDALAMSLGGTGAAPSVYNSDTFTYNGAIKFETKVGPATTIGGWLATGGGTVSDLDIGGLQQSKGSIGDTTATTTFYLFEAVGDVFGAAGATVEHDDGFAIFREGSPFAGVLGPNQVQTTPLAAFDLGKFELLYVATNSDPSILKVEGLTAVPLPAGGLLLLTALGGIAVLRRRKTA